MHASGNSAAWTQQLVANAEIYVQGYMARYDASHDWSHIQRVVELARYIWDGETAALNGTNASCSWHLVHLAALLHDVGDPKYAKPGEYESQPVHNLLIGWGAKKELASRVQTVVKNVSYSHEMKDPQAVRHVIEQCPELAIVQDADRLDAIGAVGVGRTFTFSGAKRPNEGMSSTIQHFHEKLERVKNYMKTRSGLVLAEERTKRLVLFRQWWEEENGKPAV